MKVERLPLATIRPYWNNPRVNDKAVQLVMDSIGKYGFNVPLVLDKDHVIISGHTRYKALIQMGLEHAYCVIADHLSKKAAKEFRIADNKTSEIASWDLSKLIPELRGVDIENMTAFFPEFDLEELLKDTGESYTPPTAADFAKTDEHLSNMYAERSDAAHDDMLDVTCPHCGASYSLSANEIGLKINGQAPEA